MDDFDRDDDTFVPPWQWVNRCSTDRLTTTTSVVRHSTHAAKFTVHDDDVSPCTPTDNPRAQLDGDRVFSEGIERYIGWSTHFPGDFPYIPGTGWFASMSLFGPPLQGKSADRN